MSGIGTKEVSRLSLCICRQYRRLLLTTTQETITLRVLVYFPKSWVMGVANNYCAMVENCYECLSFLAKLCKLANIANCARQIWCFFFFMLWLLCKICLLAILSNNLLGVWLVLGLKSILACDRLERWVQLMKTFSEAAELQ